MDLSLEPFDLAVYVNNQMRQIFPDDDDVSGLPPFVDRALERLEHCFSNLRLKGYRGGNGNPRFNRYANHFLVYQNCTVGSNLAGDHPSFGKGVVMYGGSRVIGKTHVGDNSLIQTGAIIMDAGELPPNSVLHGVYPDAGPSQSRRNVVADIFMQ